MSRAHLSASASLAELSPVTASMFHRYGPRRTQRAVPVAERFEALAQTIVYQQLAGRAAATIWARVAALVPGRLETSACERDSRSPSISASFPQSETCRKWERCTAYFAAFWPGTAGGLPTTLSVDASDPAMGGRCETFGRLDEPFRPANRPGCLLAHREAGNDKPRIDSQIPHA